MTASLAIVACCLRHGPAAGGGDGKHLFVLAGQSNMRPPLPQAFTEAVTAVFGKDKVVVVSRAHPGQPIKHWYKAWVPPQGMTDPRPERNGKLYDELIGSVKRTVKDSRPASVTLIWMQGEADAKSGWGGVYERSFRGILDQLKKDLGVNEVNFVVGRINDFWTDPERFPDGDLVRGIQEKLGTQAANGAWVDTDDLNRGVNPWGGFSFDDGHFPPPGYRVMGLRFARKACRIVDPNRTLDEKVFAVRFFDSAAQVKRHAAIGASVRGSEPAAKHDAGGAGLAALVDGRFGTLDRTDTAWVGFAPSEKGVELVVDLGKPVALDAIAVNMLVGSEASAEFPGKLTYSISEDGKAYTVPNRRYNTVSFSDPRNLARLRKDGIKPQAVLVLTEQNRVVARYVRVQIETGKQWVFLDELIINPSAE